MKTFLVRVSWEALVDGFIEVEAESPEVAARIAEQTPHEHFDVWESESGGIEVDEVELIDDGEES
jgi:hypothetical protein